MKNNKINNSGKKEKCLVEEARKKCKCEWCKLNRNITQMAINSYVQLETLKLFMDIHKDTQKMRNK